MPPTKHPLPQPSLDHVLVQSMGDVLRKFLGETPAEIILKRVQNHSSEAEDISKRAEVFSASLREALGPGSILIEKSILRRIYCELGFEFEQKERYGFSDYVHELKRKSRSRMNE